MDDFTPQPEQSVRKLEDPKDTSSLKFYSIALVVRTPASFPSKIIEVTPIESLSIQTSGKVERDDITYKHTHQELDGSFQSQPDVFKNNVIEAEWMPLSDSNRATPPCVYRDESVMLFKYGDVQKYYWATLKHQPELRKKEMVRWGASNETTPLVPYTKETSYFIEFNALTQKLEIGTPVNGESVSYRILLDVGNSQLDIADNLGNSLILKSSEGTLSVNTTKDVVVNAGGKIDLNAPSTTINSPTITLNGEVVVTKGLKLAGGITVAGGGGGKAATIGGDLYVKGNLQAQSVNSNAITQGGYSSSDVSVQATQNQSAKAASAPASAGKGGSSGGGGGSAGGSAGTESTYADHPSPQTDKTYQVDQAATTNANSTLTGDKVLDAPKLATGEVPKTFTKTVPGMDAVKETASKMGGVGQQLSSTASSTADSLSGGIQGVVNTARSVQQKVSSTISGVTSSVSATISSVHSTVMDPINGVTRQVNTSVGGIISPINGFSSGVSNQVNGFLQPLNAISQTFTGKALVNNPLGNFDSKISNLTSQINKVNQQVNDPLNKATRSISKMTNTVNGAVGQANYATRAVTDPLRAVTNTTESVQNTANTTRRQLNDLSTQTGKVISNVSTLSDKASTLIPRSKTLDQLT